MPSFFKRSELAGSEKKRIACGHGRTFTSENGWIVRETIFSLTELIFARIFPVLQDGRAKDHSVSLFRDAPVRDIPKSQIVLRKYYCFREHMCFIIVQDCGMSVVVMIMSGICMLMLKFGLL